MFQGTTITLGDREWIIPPLTLPQVREVLPRVKEIGGTHPSELAVDQLAIIAEIVALAMQRNYPELTVAEVDAMLDLGNTPEVLSAILGGLGGRKVTVEAPQWPASSP